MKKEKRFSISLKLRLYISIVTLTVLFGSMFIAYNVVVRQIDNNFKKLAQGIASNYAAFIDTSFYSKLKEIISTEEYRELRDTAEEEDNELLIEGYLKEQGVWEDYISAKDLLSKYLENTEAARYLYVMILNNNEDYDIYLMDTYEEPLYSTGMSEAKEKEFEGIDTTQYFEPVINEGPWGWLCSVYQIVYDADGNYLCHVGCDIEMSDIVVERNKLLFYIFVGSTLFTILVVFSAIY